MCDRRLIVSCTRTEFQAGCSACSGSVRGLSARVPVQRRPIPDRDGPVVAGRGDEPTVDTKRYAADDVRVPAEGDGLLTGLGVPELYNTVFVGRNQALAVGAERQARN